MSDYRPREHDHLVEPVFHGLGVAPRPPGAPPSLLRRVWSALVRLVRPSRPAGGR